MAPPTNRPVRPEARATIVIAGEDGLERDEARCGAFDAGWTIWPGDYDGEEHETRHVHTIIPGFVDGDSQRFRLFVALEAAAGAELVVDWRTLWPHERTERLDALPADEYRRSVLPGKILQQGTLRLKRAKPTDALPAALRGRRAVYVSSWLMLAANRSDLVDVNGIASGAPGYPMLQAHPRGWLEVEVPTPRGRGGASRRALPVWREVKVVPVEVAVLASGERRWFDPSNGPDGRPRHAADQVCFAAQLDAAVRVFAGLGVELNTYLDPALPGCFQVESRVQPGAEGLWTGLAQPTGLVHCARFLDVQSDYLPPPRGEDDGRPDVGAISHARAAGAEGRVGWYSRAMTCRAHPPRRPGALRLFFANTFVDGSTRGNAIFDEFVSKRHGGWVHTGEDRSCFVYLDKRDADLSSDAALLRRYKVPLFTAAHELGHVLGGKNDPTLPGESVYHYAGHALEVNVMCAGETHKMKTYRDAFDARKRLFDESGHPWREKIREFPVDG